MRRFIVRPGGEPKTRAPAGFLPAVTTSLGVLAFAAWLGLAGQANGQAPAKAEKAAASQVIAGVATVIDADTLDIHGQRVRLVGVDAPESGQQCLSADATFVRCGSVAANALDAWINRNPVSCDIQARIAIAARSANAACAAKASRNG